MVAVHTITWEEASAPDFETPTRQAWREAVAEIAAKAHEKLPDSRSRIDKAVGLVLAGDVALMPDGTARVASQSNGSTTYHIVNGHCDCRDFERAPGQLCKHRLAFGLSRRAQELTKAKVADTNGQTEAPHQPAPAQPEAPTAPLPEAPVSITLKARTGQGVCPTRSQQGEDMARQGGKDRGLFQRKGSADWWIVGRAPMGMSTREDWPEGSGAHGVPEAQSGGEGRRVLPDTGSRTPAPRAGYAV